MKNCLSAAHSGSNADLAKMTPQERMKECNVQAKGKSGDDRKKFMSNCLSTH